MSVLDGNLKELARGERAATKVCALHWWPNKIGGREKRGAEFPLN